MSTKREDCPFCAYCNIRIHPTEKKTEKDGKVYHDYHAKHHKVPIKVLDKRVN